MEPYLHPKYICLHGGQSQLQRIMQYSEKMQHELYQNKYRDAMGLHLKLHRMKPTHVLQLTRRHTSASKYRTKTAACMRLRRCGKYEPLKCPVQTHENRDEVHLVFYMSVPVKNSTKCPDILTIKVTFHTY
jgi:hypothetical protein